MQMLKKDVAFKSVHKPLVSQAIKPNRNTAAYRAIYNKLMTRIHKAVQEAEEEMNQLTP